MGSEPISETHITILIFLSLGLRFPLHYHWYGFTPLMATDSGRTMKRRLRTFFRPAGVTSVSVRGRESVLKQACWDPSRIVIVWDCIHKLSMFLFLCLSSASDC
ncbi:hypothetical protein CPC08DRAFT_243216 [Agrocybe pediades]|nr:hypothetical protein CPC08DRAFT_243216 [Agrocybe pediades]